MHPSTILVREMVARAVRARTAVLLLAVLAACDKVPLTAPTESTIALFATGTSVPLNGAVDLVATVTEKPGTPVQNGTLVTFTTTLGRIDPPEARTNNGKVTVRLTADGRSGTAKVTAISGGATKGELEIPIGAAAADNLVVRAEPTSVGASGGTVQVIATVRDSSGNGLAGVTVTFSATAGQLSPASANTDANGEARTSLSTVRESVVTASAGNKTATVTVTYTAAPTIAVTASPTDPTIGQAVTFQIAVTPAANGLPIDSISIDFGDGDSERLGTSGTSVAHVYTTAGTFTVRVTVRDVSGQESEQITILNVSGVVSVGLTVDDSTVTVNTETAVFHAIVSGATVLQYRWNFGDGSEQTTTVPNAQHVYTTIGVKIVTVTVTTTGGSTGTAQLAVSVVN
jgi:PKD repeat protein